LSIMREIALRRVKVVHAHHERIEIEMVRNVQDRALHSDDPLRDAEPAKRGVRHRMGLASVRLDADVLEEIGIVAMKDSAVGNRRRQVEAVSATKLLTELDADDAADVVQSDLLIDL